MDFRDIFFSNIRGGLIGLLCAVIFLFLVWAVAFMVAFGNPGPFADAYLAIAGILFSGIVPLVILVAGYLVGVVCIRR